jgi:hypothetical protein
VKLWDSIILRPCCLKSLKSPALLKNFWVAWIYSPWNYLSPPQAHLYFQPLLPSWWVFYPHPLNEQWYPVWQTANGIVERLEK